MADECTYIIGDTVLARGVAKQLPPWSLSLTCYYCKKEWGRIERDGVPSFRAYESVCLACGPGLSRHRIAGSFLPALENYPAANGFDYEWQNNLPAPIIAHEARLGLAWFEFERIDRELSLRRRAEWGKLVRITGLLFAPETNEGNSQTLFNCENLTGE